MGLFDGVGKGAVEGLQETVDDVQADLDKRWAALVALLAGKRLKITIEVEDKAEGE